MNNTGVFGHKRRGLTRSLRRILHQKLLVLGSTVWLLLFLIIVFPHEFATHDPLLISTSNKHEPPSTENWFGTDELGRDVYSRVIFGMRPSFTAGLVVVGGALFVGTLMGTVAGYRGGFTDDFIMRISDIFLAFPSLIMAMTVTAVLGPGLQNAMLALIVVWWPQYARLSRGLVVSVKHSLFVEAAKSIGASEGRVLFRHLLPNIITPIFVKGTLDLGQAILLTAALSFLGLGVQPPDPELGSMVTAGRNFIVTSWWYSTFPGLIIFIAVLAINLVGDGLRDILDPVLKSN